MTFKTEYDFELPRGYVDDKGDLHKKGTMRLATAADEILPMRDPRVQQNPSYLTIILLSRVVTNLGTLRAIDTKVIEKLFTTDLSYLQSIYQQINEMESPTVHASCPKCQHDFEVEVDFLGEMETV